jgi:hypothetical protein
MDLVPTLLALTDFELAADMPGNVIESALLQPLHERLPGFVASYEPEPRFVPDSAPIETSPDSETAPPSGG